MLKTRSPEAQAFIMRYHISWEQILLPLTYFCCPSQVLPKILKEKHKPSGRAAMDTQVGPSASQGSITVFPKNATQTFRTRYSPAPTSATSKKQLRESFHDLFQQSPTHLVNILGARFQPDVRSFVFKGRKIRLISGIKWVVLALLLFPSEVTHAEEEI